MDKKPLIIIEHDPDFRVLKANLDSGYKMYDDATEFLKKQAKKSYEELVKIHWEAIEDALKKRNLIPDDFNDDSYELVFSGGVLYMRSKRKDPRSIFDFILNHDDC